MRFTLFCLSRCLILLPLCTAAARATAQPLRPGTPIKVTLQRTLSTHPRGGFLNLIEVKPNTREGTAVIFEVAEDVPDEDGNIVIERGTPAVGQVIDSQVAGGLKPQPRLAITIDRTWTIKDEPVELRFERKHEGKWGYAFSRQETAAFAATLQNDEAEIAFSDPVNREVIYDLAELLVRGEVDDLIKNPARVTRLRTFAKQSGMRGVVEYIRSGRLLDMAKLIAEIQSGTFAWRSLTDVRRLAVAFGLLHDTWRAGNQITRYFTRRFKAPQIIAPVGFPMECVVAG